MWFLHVWTRGLSGLVGRALTLFVCGTCHRRNCILRTSQDNRSEWEKKSMKRCTHSKSSHYTESLLVWSSTLPLCSTLRSDENTNLDVFRKSRHSRSSTPVHYPVEVVHRSNHCRGNLFFVNARLTCNRWVDYCEFLIKGYNTSNPDINGFWRQRVGYRYDQDVCVFSFCDRQ